MSYVRECFSKSVLLGTLDNPLRPKETCEPSDISEEGQKVFACLCENDYCNSYRSPDEPRPSLPPPLLSKEDPRVVEVNKTLIGRGEQEDVSRIQSQSPAKIITNTNQDPVTTERQVTAARKSPLRCHTCGNLFNPDNKCEEFSVTREDQVEECEAGEVCLLYMWHKSDSVTAAVRHCFPETILLGSIQAPLRPGPGCQLRDITEDGSAGIRACLCDSDLCNNKILPDISHANNGDKETIHSAAASSSTTMRGITTLPILAEIVNKSPPPNNVPQEVPRTSGGFKVDFDNSFDNFDVDRDIDKCPDGFSQVDKDCFYVSRDKVTWIEARKLCENRSSTLLAIESELKSIKLSNLLKSVVRRHYNEFWTSGNDIIREGDWVWADDKWRKVPDFGWSEQSFSSIEENCLVWVVEMPSQGAVVTDGWHGASCCNMHRYICQYDPRSPAS